jgi:hypothetical protein
MSNADGWSSAQEPRFVAGPSFLPDRIPPHIKHQQALALRSAVDAHRRAGGAYVVLDGTPVAPAPRRQLGE